MLYTEDTRIEALAVHVVGNKSKDEPLTVSPELSAQVADEGLMRTLTAYFLGGFKSEECYNLHHETDLGCNEVWNFACRIFDDPEALLEHSVSLAKHLYESGMHPQIKGGEFYTVYFSDCNFGGWCVFWLVSLLCEKAGGRHYLRLCHWALFLVLFGLVLGGMLG